MRKLQNTVSTLGNVNVRQGNQLIVGVEALRSLCANLYSALRSYTSRLAIVLRRDVWQGPSASWLPSIIDGTRLDTGTSFASAIKAVVKRPERRHQIMCHRTAA